jgi:hypothetical protein
MREARCGRCGARVLVAKSGMGRTTGTDVMLDPQVTPDGQWHVNRDGYLTRALPALNPRGAYRAHFTTCPAMRRQS